MIWDRNFTQYLYLNAHRWFMMKEINPTYWAYMDSRVRVQLFVKIDDIKL